MMRAGTRRKEQHRFSSIPQAEGKDDLHEAGACSAMLLARLLPCGLLFFFGSPPARPLPVRIRHTPETAHTTPPARALTSA